MSADFQKPTPLSADGFLVGAEAIPDSVDNAPYRPQYVDRPEQRATGPLFKDEFVLAEIDGHDQDVEYLKLQPPQGLSPAQRRIVCMEPISLTEEEDQRPFFQFSLKEMMVLSTFLSVGLAITHYFPSDMVAGVLGFLALVGQGLLMRFPPENRHIRLAAWVLLAMYAVAAATAFVQHIWL